MTETKTRGQWEHRSRTKFFMSLILNSLLLSSLSRLLEEGNTEGAEEQKQRIEQLQRERRKVLQENNMIHQPRFFKYAVFFLLVCTHAFECSQPQWLITR